MNNTPVCFKELGCAARRKARSLASQTSDLQRRSAPKSDGANGRQLFLATSLACIAQQSREHTTGTKQQPEERGVGTFFHDWLQQARTSVTTQATAATLQPVRCMRSALSRSPLITMGAMVLGMISNQL